MKKIIPLLVISLFLAGCGRINETKPQLPAVCALESCHGMNISCGSNPPQACDAMYALGDRCMQFAQCGIVHNSCQVIANEKFDSCKSCVDKCQSTHSGDIIKVFQCESVCDNISNVKKEIPYVDTMLYIDSNITRIMDNTFSTKPANSKRFATSYNFTSPSDVYVDFEDGHYAYKALLKCDNSTTNELTCTVVGIFENKEKIWTLIQGTDTQKNKPILYTKSQ